MDYLANGLELAPGTDRSASCHQTAALAGVSFFAQVADGLIKTSRDAVVLLGTDGGVSGRIPMQAPFWGGPYYFLLRFNAEGKLIAHGVYPD